MKTITAILAASFLCGGMTASAQDAYSQRKAQDKVRAEYWAGKGYRFDATYMTASMMDRKVVDIQRAAQWKQNNPLFPALRSAPTAVSRASRQKQIPSSTPQGHGLGKTSMKRPAPRGSFIRATGTHALLPNGLQGGSGHGCKTCIHQITYRVDLLAGPELDP